MQSNSLQSIEENIRKRRSLESYKEKASETIDTILELTDDWPTEGLETFLKELERLIRVVRECEGIAERPEKGAMTDEESREVEKKRTVPFGMYEGVVLKDVRLDYLVWLDSVGYEFSKMLHAYLGSPRIQKEIEESNL